MNFTEGELLNYLASFIWPFFRVSSMFVTVPVFSVASVPARLRVLTGLLITLAILPTLPPMPAIDVFSSQGWMVTIQQIALGMTAGFILQMVFSFMMFAGQTIAYSMGLGFASLVDPATGVQVPVIAQLFVIASSLLFLTVDGHLLLIEMLAQSFHTLPVATLGMDQADLWRIIVWSSQIFAGGLLLSMPVMTALLFVNISFGVASKAAPQLQIFGVGFPITILLGMVLIWIGLPTMLEAFTEMLHESFTLISQLLRLN
ncbi:MAG: flagellar biosynthetic protein FliR [Methylococcaceae bacterium]|nr:flagellar biosynthetic protein FliR [Methylococcaceae bacterium]